MWIFFLILVIQILWGGQIEQFLFISYRSITKLRKVSVGYIQQNVI